VQEHSDTNKTVHQREVLARPTLALKDTLRLDLSKAHLIEKTESGEYASSAKRGLSTGAKHARLLCTLTASLPTMEMPKRASPQLAFLQLM